MEYTKEELQIIYQSLCEVNVKGQFVEMFSEIKRKVKEDIDNYEQPKK